jgi:hypothetical protein
MGSVRIPLMVVGALAMLFFCLGRSPAISVSTFNAPDGLRQIDVLALSPAKVEFWVHDAGYHLRHRRELVAVLYGAPSWGVTWQGANAITIHVPHGDQSVTRGKPSDLDVKISK